MRKTLKAIYTVAIFVAVLGLFIGPISWYLTYSFKAEYDAFSKTAIEADGVVYKKFKEFGGRTSRFYVGIRYSKRPFDISLASKVKVLGSMHGDLEKGDKIVVLWGSKVGKPGEIRIKGETDFEHLPPSRLPYLGMILTIFSYSFMLFVIFFAKRIIRHLNRVEEMKSK